MTTSQHKSTWSTWLIIALVTSILVALAYFILQADKDQAQQTAKTKSELPAAAPESATKEVYKNLDLAIQALAEENEVSITLDNPYMEDCEVPEFLSQNLPFKKVLSTLAKKYQLEIHQPAPNEYILIGGTCQ